VGTIRDWGQIVAISAFLGLYGWARDMGHKPYPNKLGRLLAGWFLGSVALGIGETFRSEAFRLPLLFITLSTAAGSVILCYFARPRGGQQAPTEPSAGNPN
jgi:hypothetical protein